MQSNEGWCFSGLERRQGDLICDGLVYFYEYFLMYLVWFTGVKIEVGAGDNTGRLGEALRGWLRGWIAIRHAYRGGKDAQFVPVKLTTSGYQCGSNRLGMREWREVGRREMPFGDGLGAGWACADLKLSGASWWVGGLGQRARACE